MTHDTSHYHTDGPNYATALPALFLDQSISDGAVRLYLYLQWRAGQKNSNFRKKATMASELGVTARTIRNRAAELVAAGWLAIVERDVVGAEQTSNHYHVFQYRKMSKMWRAGFKPAEGERLQPIPKVEARKSRKGKGGAPKKAVKLNTDGVNSSSQPPGTQVHPNELPSNSVQEIAANAAHVPSNGVKAGSYQERTGKTDAECEAERIAEAEKQLALDLWRMNMNEQLDLLGKAVKHYFGYGGTLATKYARMFYGVFKGGKKKSADDSVYAEQTALLKDAPITANEFTDWAAEYCKERGYEPNHKEMVRDPEKVVSYILARRDRIAAKVIAAPVIVDDTPELTEAERLEAAEFMRANRPDFGGKAAS